ncbi:hypothetical protein P7228_05470 [Altererythrobacter arenosus]|uniref:Uncharacterized protein n=1 Tax=Altererythrobacter arenosus TaxID=3032592 RepID=A0ABY8FYZ1_9SPHN|nr:hypothetical protein [Altererythrobacter sp. CAU 1644]WFL78516.1 hypothetical protein P7228_05470 [Altererythrobacter sp. CAU 1644]
MTGNWKALAWAALIIGAALLAKAQGLSDAASFGIVAGLSGAAVGSLRSRVGGCIKAIGQ